MRLHPEYSDIAEWYSGVHGSIVCLQELEGHGDRLAPEGRGFLWEEGCVALRGVSRRDTVGLVSRHS